VLQNRAGNEEDNVGNVDVGDEDDNVGNVDTVGATQGTQETQPQETVTQQETQTEANVTKKGANKGATIYALRIC